MNNVRVGSTGYTILGEWMKGKQMGGKETGEEDRLKKRFDIEMEEKKFERGKRGDDSPALSKCLLFILKWNTG